MPTLGIEEKWLLGWQGYLLGTHLGECEGERKVQFQAGADTKLQAVSGAWD